MRWIPGPNQKFPSNEGFLCARRTTGQLLVLIMDFLVGASYQHLPGIAGQVPVPTGGLLVAGTIPALPGQQSGL